MFQSQALVGPLVTFYRTQGSLAFQERNHSKTTRLGGNDFIDGAKEGLSGKVPYELRPAENELASHAAISVPQ